MNMSDKSIERLLYLISPIGLLAAWQLLLMAGFGDRRFIPAPSDIAVPTFTVAMRSCSARTMRACCSTSWRTPRTSAYSPAAAAR